jgi:hypothetical protein
VQPLRELIADSLELPQIEQARLGGHASVCFQATHRPGGHERVRELALEFRDLPSEGAASGTLGVLDRDRSNCRRKHLRSVYVVLEQRTYLLSQRA